ncbi:MAG: OmpA family protein [Deltaproteobacteria bacterium]|nr:OmpA family protein [Deltaproteobacteria bacterium]
MVDLANRVSPLRFSLGVTAEALGLRWQGEQPCGVRVCDTRGEVNAFGPGLALGFATTQAPGFLFEARLGLSYHWGSRTEATANSSGLVLAENHRDDALWSLNAHLGMGVNLQSVAFYAFGEFLYAGSVVDSLRAYTLSPGFGISFGPNRLFNLEASYFPFLVREGATEDKGGGFVVRAYLDFMALLNRPNSDPRVDRVLIQNPPPQNLRIYQTVVANPPPLEVQVSRVPVRVVGNFIQYVGRIHFHYNSALIREDDGSFAAIDQVAAFLRGHPEIRRLEVQGHTDDQGPDPYNDNLSRRRASAVRRALIDRGVAPDRLSAIGYGEHRPMVQNRSPETRALNRRVEFHVLER